MDGLDGHSHRILCVCHLIIQVIYLSVRNEGEFVGVVTSVGGPVEPNLT